MTERVFLLPDPGEGLTEAEVITWLVAEGDTVELNQPIAEVETAKAVVEIPSPFAGVVVRLHVPAGGSVAVGEALVTFAVGGGDTGSAGGSARSHAVTSEEGQAPIGSARGAGPPAAPASPPGDTARSTPPVRRLARELGVEIGGVDGTGSGGRVTADDVRRAAAGSVPDEGSGVERVPVSGVRGAVAEMLTRQAAIPQVTTFRTVECSALEALRSELEVSPLPVVAAALCGIVTAHPLLNAVWERDAVVMRGAVGLGIAVDTEHGLLVPVVRDAQGLGIAGLAGEIRRLAELARSGHLRARDTADATIGISNTGSYGSEAGTPILTPGSAVTIAIGVIGPRALVVRGEVEARPACTLSLTFDHRVLDGAAAGRALTDLVALLQDVARLRDLPR
jgi:2-oxoisovalerate dehydrogenase E2 component (dihydrolipoyl transacylase)